MNVAPAVALTSDKGKSDGNAAVESLYERLEFMSKVLESSGLLDEMDHPGTYATVLDAMNAVRAMAEPAGKVVAAVSGPNDAAMIQWTGDYRPKVGDLIYAASQPVEG